MYLLIFDSINNKTFHCYTYHISSILFVLIKKIEKINKKIILYVRYSNIFSMHFWIFYQISLVTKWKKDFNLMKPDLLIQN